MRIERPCSVIGEKGRLGFAEPFGAGQVPISDREFHGEPTFTNMSDVKHG